LVVSPTVRSRRTEPPLAASPLQQPSDEDMELRIARWRIWWKPPEEAEARGM
jgi:hypothetical protein